MWNSVGQCFINRYPSKVLQKAHLTEDIQQMPKLYSSTWIIMRCAQTCVVVLWVGIWELTLSLAPFASPFFSLLNSVQVSFSLGNCVNVWCTHWLWQLRTVLCTTVIKGTVIGTCPVHPLNVDIKTCNHCGSVCDITSPVICVCVCVCASWLYILVITRNEQAVLQTEVNKECRQLPTFVRSI